MFLTSVGLQISWVTMRVMYDLLPVGTAYVEYIDTISHLMHERPSSSSRSLYIVIYNMQKCIVALYETLNNIRKYESVRVGVCSFGHMYIRQCTSPQMFKPGTQELTLTVLNFWKFTSYCSLKPLWSSMAEVVPARTLPTLHPPSPPTAHQLSWLAL